METKLACIPKRHEKPRINGLTIIQDSGLSLGELENIISSSGHLIDMVRMLPGAICSAESLSGRVAKYKQAGISPFISGIMFEGAYIRDNIDQYIGFLKTSGFDYVEISDSIIEIAPEIKAGIIEKLSKEMKVVSKIGAKSERVLFPYMKWKEYIQAELKAGSEKLIIEGDTAGITRYVSGKAEIKSGLVGHIMKFVNIDEVIWETPDDEQQTWFINEFGTDVNLADINPARVLDLESYRLGISWKTFTKNIPESKAEDMIRKTDPILNIDYQI